MFMTKTSVRLQNLERRQREAFDAMVRLDQNIQALLKRIGQIEKALTIIGEPLTAAQKARIIKAPANLDVKKEKR